MKLQALLLSLCLGASAAHADVLCLSGEAARQTFTDEKAEPYFSLLQPREMSAKTGRPAPSGDLPEQRAAVRSLYAAATQDCTPEEVQGLKAYVELIQRAAGSGYPGLVDRPWRFIKIRDDIEGGLPHTRGVAIVLPASLMRSYARSAQARQWNLGLVDLLLHEQVHVIQRQRTAEFADLYTRAWGFRRVKGIDGAADWLARHHIVNPDGVDVGWVWPVPGTQRVIWPLVILAGESPQPAMPDDFRMVGVELEADSGGYRVAGGQDGAPQYRQLSEEPAYSARFAGVSSLYHPNEIAADALSELVLWDSLVDHAQAPPAQQAAIEGRARTLREWARKTFAR